MTVSSVVSGLTPYSPPGPCWATLVFAHGAGAGQRHPFMVQAAEALASQGIAVTTFDFPYMAEGRRLPDRLPRLTEAFAEAVGAVHAAHPSLPVFLAGKSMGGRVATHLAADPPPGLPALAGVIALGYPLTPPTARRPVDRVSHLQRLTRPLLVVQGTRDAFGSAKQVQDILGAACHGPVTVVAVPEADHGFAVPARSRVTQQASTRDWQAALVAWMRAHTGTAASP